jgi:hypothetical protein
VGDIAPREAENFPVARRISSCPSPMASAGAIPQREDLGRKDPIRRRCWSRTRPNARARVSRSGFASRLMAYEPYSNTRLSLIRPHRPSSRFPWAREPRRNGALQTSTAMARTAPKVTLCDQPESLSLRRSIGAIRSAWPPKCTPAGARDARRQCARRSTSWSSSCPEASTTGAPPAPRPYWRIMPPPSAQYTLVASNATGRAARF